MTIKEKLGLATNPVFLMDGTAYIYRAFYANRHLQRSDGFPTNALVVVTRVLLRILREENPEYLLFAMDGKGRNFRNEIYAAYKANREAMPEELAQQIDPIKRMVAALGLKTEVAVNFEADDCIASMAEKISPHLPVVIVSGDKDLKQCLAPNVFMWDPGSKEEKLLTMAAFEAESGVPPAHWPDVQAIIGDSSDNIPGVPGIGPKTARQIFDICPTLEDIRDHFALLAPKVQDKLKPHMEEMFKWRELTTLKRNACPELDVAAIAVKPVDLKACGQLAAEYELFAVRREIDGLLRSRAALGAGQQNAPDEDAVQAMATEISVPPAVDTAEIATLPDCAGKTVAVIWPDGQNTAPLVAVGSPVAGIDATCGAQSEYCWKGTQANLCTWLAKSGKIIVADIKSLLVASPSWHGLAAAPGHPEFMDLGLASYLLNPEDGDYRWTRLAARWREQLKCLDKGPAILALAMGDALAGNLAANGLTGLYNEMELPLVQVLAAMEKKGVAVDPAAFQSFLDEVQMEVDRLTEEVFAEAGTTFNIRSSQQIGEILFDRLHLGASRKTKSGQYSTSQATLEKLVGESPVVESILQFRKLDKMRSTYLDPLPRLMDSQNRLHTTFNQEATATGRLSSSNPNLQNIPVRGPMGARMRSCFVAAPGNSLVAADYSQIELRILAHLSQDKALLEAFRDGRDIHTRTAALVFDIPSDQVLPDQRRMAKTINFGLLYGMGAQKLAQELKINTAKAREFIDRYFERLSGLKQFYEKVIEGAREKGYVTTMAGRRRWLPGIFSANGQTAAQAQRQAVNTVIQGSAADVIKLAMLGVAKDDELAGSQASLVLQIHDELLLEVPEEHACAAGARVARIMENVQPGGETLSVPLMVDWGTGKNWGTAH